MIHPSDYQLQQAFHADHLAAAAQQRLVADAMRSVAGRRRPANVLRAVAASLVVVLVAVAIWLPRPTTESPAPGDAIDRLVSAARANDVDAATVSLESGATISDSSRNVQDLSDATTWDATAAVDTQSRLQYLSDLYAAALAAENSGYQGFIAPQEVLGTADLQVMCAVVTGGQINAVIALAPKLERSCQVAEPASGTSVPWMLVVAASITSLFLLAHRMRAPQLTTGRRPFIQALGAWHTSMVGAEPSGPSNSSRRSPQCR